ncbi:sigma-70 family RNA polymerase sigma factor [Rhodoplanes sp. Z2-YC6860]|uniref:sigma-70 family RNA polymerase sigma factor n=1 Tax=Rhodoplanes sp. Z2-YC6860 TaxID=674703 RepID=UPI00078EA43C|nr:sigma-70 family RNA polymerase sigma factor [Rhodoplanes sp. Z2-YC6860]AMN40823.1 ECF subfamily RNA polymerase sigma-24 factor [Rhodoplanes sp. Z2-YC6860]
MGGGRTWHGGINGKSPILQPDVREPADWVRAIARDADKEAFTRLFEFYAPRVKAFLIRLGSDAGLAEEMAQETLLLVWRKAAMFDPTKAGVGTWIFTIARNLRIDRARRGSGVSVEAIYDVLTSEAPVPPDETLLADERDERVRSALQDLPSDQVSVVRMSFFENKPHAEIATALGLPLGTVKSRLRLAMKRLRERLEERS